MKISKDLKILIVDDSIDSLVIIKNVLTGKGFKNIITVFSAEEAKKILQSAEESRDPVRLILSDWEMPGMSGKELLQFIRESESFSQVPFIMVTSNNEIECVTDAINLGVSNYIVKPINFNVVINKVASAIRMQKEFSH